MTERRFVINFGTNIKDVNVIDHKYKKSTEAYGDDRYIKLQIGDPNEKVIGEQEYVITYKSEISDDNFTEFDEFYQDLIFCAYWGYNRKSKLHY